MQKRLKDYFIPHSGNKYKPNSLELAAVKGMAVMVMLSFAIANFQSFIWPSSDWLISTILPAVIVDLTNEEREYDSLVDLRRSSTLDTAATLKAQHMAANQYFAHESPDGITPWHWFEVADYNFVHAGENLAIHFTDSDEVVKAWMGSPTHKANIMNGNYTEIGVGTAKGTYEGFNTVYVVQLFGTPAAGSAVSSETTDSILVPESTVVTSPEPAAVLAAEAVAEDESEAVLVSASDTDKQQVIDDIMGADEPPVFASDFVSTSTGAVPATVEPTLVLEDKPTGLAGFLTRPQLTLEILYALAATFVLISLLLAIFIEIRRQQPVQIAYALVLLGMMYGLWELHATLTGGAIIV